MTLRDSRLRSANEPTNRKASSRGRSDRLKRKQRRKDRRLLSETLEQRQLLAGPDLIGIQPNEGSLLVDGTVLNVSPNELIFRFGDSTLNSTGSAIVDNNDIDPSTLSAIRITRAGDDGVFESASATSDLGTNGAILVEFKAIQTGSLGNGVQVNFTSNFSSGIQFAADFGHRQNDLNRR